MRTLKRARNLLGCTQEQLAECVGIAPQTLRNLEIGRTQKPQRVTREKFEKKLGLIDWLWTYQDGKLSDQKEFE